MKAFILATTTLVSLVSTASWATAPTSAGLCAAEYEQVKDSRRQLRLKEKEFKSICAFKNLQGLTADKAFLLKKWGQQICDDLMQTGGNYELQCNYRNLLTRGHLDLAEAMAVAGYTASFYNYLNPENLQIKPGQQDYEGYDVFNRVLVGAIGKLNQQPEFQYGEVSYRGSSLHGRTYAVDQPVTITRWNSSSCAKEIAYGPVTVEISEAEKAKLIAEEGEDAAGLEYLFYKRDEKSIPAQMTACEKIYFGENPRPPLSPDSHFGDGDLKVIFLPPAKGISKRVVLYDLSDRRSEMEILVPPGTQFKVIRVTGPQDAGGDGYNTEVTMQEQDN